MSASRSVFLTVALAKTKKYDASSSPTISLKKMSSRIPNFIGVRSLLDLDCRGLALVERLQIRLWVQRHCNLKFADGLLVFVSRRAGIGHKRIGDQQIDIFE